jgi:hypothetical protein
MASPMMADVDRSHAMTSSDSLSRLTLSHMSFLFTYFTYKRVFKNLSANYNNLLNDICTTILLRMK